MIALLLILGLLPGFAWLVFYVEEEETHPEPRRLIVLAFAAGIAAGLVAVVLESVLQSAAAGVGIEEFSLVALAAFALIEETVKFGAAYLTIGKSRLARNPVDLMIYLIVAALGFATLENIGALVTFWLGAHAAGQGHSRPASLRLSRSVLRAPRSSIPSRQVSSVTIGHSAC